MGFREGELGSWARGFKKRCVWTLKCLRPKVRIMIRGNRRGKNGKNKNKNIIVVNSIILIYGINLHKNWNKRIF